MRSAKPNPHRARRRRLFAAGGVCALLSALFVSLCVWSAWWFAWWIGPWGAAINVSSGGVSFVNWRAATPSQRGWTIASSPERRFNHGFKLDRGTGGSLPYVRVPLWALATVAAIGGALFIRRARNVPASGCTGCGYDVAGLVADGPCPECGGYPGSPGTPIRSTPPRDRV